jgi:hypothetical protein
MKDLHDIKAYNLKSLQRLLNGKCWKCVNAFLHLWKRLGLDVVILITFISRKDERSPIKSQNISLFIL